MLWQIIVTTLVFAWAMLVVYVAAFVAARGWHLGRRSIEVKRNG